MVIDELLVSGDSLRAGMQIADSINAAKAKLIDSNAISEEGHGDQVDEYDAATVKAVGHYLKISAADHKDWWATRWYLPAGEQKPNDSVPNFKMMNDAAIALADKECRSEFVSLCVHNIEEMVKRVLAIPE